MRDISKIWVAMPAESTSPMPVISLAIASGSTSPSSAGRMPGATELPIDAHTTELN